jgi:D-alanyl-D-alanine carboxypeptidase
MQEALNSAVSTGVPGIEAAVVTDHGTWEGAAGTDGRGAAVQPQALMAIGSVSKTFTAAEVLHLVAEGVVDLDAPMSRYVTSPLVGNGATVRQALGMLGGLTDGEYMHHVNQTSARTPETHITLDQALAMDAEKPGRPGQAASYSNVSYLLLARLIERVTHHSYAAAVHADLLAPAHLTRVAVQDADKPVPPLAYPVDPYGTKTLTDGYLPDRYTTSAAVGAGSIAASAHDEALWGYDLYTGKVLPDSLTAQMVKPQRAGDYPYGLGTVIFDPGKLGIDALGVGHTGEIVHPNANGLDGYRSLLLVLPSKHVSIAVTIDTVTGDSPLATALALLRNAST